MKFQNGSNPIPSGHSGDRSSIRTHTTRRAARSLVSVVVGIGLLWSLLGSVAGLGGARAVSAASDPVIAAAGDIACDPGSASYNGGLGTSTQCHQKNTSDLLVNGGFASVLALGDDQYYCGSLTAFNQSYDPTWGRVKAMTYPVPGNHEYLTSGGTGCDSSNANAAGYFSYYGSAAGTPSQSWYSYDVGTWHIIALNSQCSAVGGCTPSSAEYQWLQSDLQAHTNYCTLAYWHIPLFSSGGRQAGNSQYFWNLLYQYNADVVLNGHDHIYERFAPQDPTGASDPVRGIRQFTVGTGGNSHTTITTIAANSQVRNADTFGILKLTLHATSYDWQFVPESGKTFTDSGTGNCHDASAMATATPTPTSSGSQSSTFVPQADAYVNSAYPTTNYGTLTSLRVDASPTINSYVRFAVSGLNGASITAAQLRFYMNTGSSSGMKLLSVADNTWSETGITYSNAPPLGATLGSVASVSGGTWVSFDVSSYVTAEGTYSFGVMTPGSTAISFAARESGANAPQLVLTLGSGTGPTATPTATAAPATPTPTPTTSVGPTPTNTPAPPTPTPTGSAQSTTFVPAADAYGNSSYPTTNFGTLTTLRVDGSPIVNTYIRFTVSGLNGATIKRVRLLLYMNTGSSAGLQALGVADNSWGETTLTYSNEPAMGSMIATSGGVTGGTWVTLDVTSYVTAEGTYSLGVITPGSTAISFASRESGANAPQLIVDTGP